MFEHLPFFVFLFSFLEVFGHDTLYDAKVNRMHLLLFILLKLVFDEPFSFLSLFYLRGQNSLVFVAFAFLLVGNQHISTLKLQEKQLVLIKEYLAHHSEAFYHVDKVDYIQVTLQLFCALY